MDNINSIKSDLLSEIKSYSISSFGEFNMLTKSFFHNLILPSYENEEIYTLLYGDINGLRKLNDRVGFDKANLAIEELLKIIFNNLPNNIVVSRIGGDEFCIIVPGLSCEQTRELTKVIHSELRSTPAVNGLDITFGACDSTEFDTIKEMYNFVESKVSLKKFAHLHLDEDATDLEDYNQKLDNFINFTIETYINNFRFSSKRIFTREDLETLSYPILDSITNLLNSETELSFSNNTSDDIVHPESDSSLPVEALKNICSLVIGDDISNDVLDDISNDDLIAIKKLLTIDPITNAYNKIYRDNGLLAKLKNTNNPFQLILVESLGLKICNSILSHAGTDAKIKSTYDSFLSELQNNIPESSNAQITPIHSGCGIFQIFVENGSCADLEHVIDTVNSDQNNFKLLGGAKNCSSISEYNNAFFELANSCEIKKNAIKDTSEYFVTQDALQLINVSLSALVNYFKTQSQSLGIYSEKEKINFTKKIISSLMDTFSELNIANQDIQKNTQDSQSEER